MIEQENWRPVIGYESKYEVSDLGRVRRVNTGRVLKLYESKGYMFVCLCSGGVMKNKYVHRLVAEAFIERPDGLYEINHKDENKSNNRVENLEWCDHKYNMGYDNRLKKAIETRIKKGSYVGFDKKEYGKKYYQEHKKERIEYGKKYYQEHKERFKNYKKDKDKQKEYSSRYYQKHKELMKEKSIKYLKEHKDKMKEYKRVYYQRHREEILRKMKEKTK